MNEDQEKRAARPRDEVFEENGLPKRHEEAEENEFDSHRQSPLVVLAIISVGLLLGFFAVLLYQANAKNHKTVINVVSSTYAEEQTSEKGNGNGESEPDSGDASEEVNELETDESGTETEAPTETPDPSYDFELNGLSYRIANGYASLQKCKSQEAAIVLPSMVDGYPLKAIWAHAFDGCEHLYYIQIPEGVWSIGEYAFANVGELKEIVFPASLRDIQPHCFDYTGGMTFISPAGCHAAEVAKASEINWVEGTALLYAH